MGGVTELYNECVLRLIDRTHFVVSGGPLYLSSESTVSEVGRKNLCRREDLMKCEGRTMSHVGQIC